MVRTIMHVGAHKTATTYMQKKLAANIDELNRRGLYYIPLNVLRRNSIAAPRKAGRKNPAFVESLRDRIKVQDVIISEENLLGTARELVRDGTYYAHVKEKLGTAASLLELDAPEIFLAVREYSGFVVSMYCEYIRFNQFIEFNDYFELYQASDFSWVRVVGDILEAVPHAQLKIWDFGRFREIEKEVFSAILGQDAGFLKELSGRVYESFSDPAIRVFEALSQVMTHQQMRPVMNAVSAALPKGDVYKAFTPLSEEASSLLKAQYQRDLKTIEEKFPQIVFIGR